MLRLLRYMRPYAIPVAAVLILVFFQCIADLYLPTLMSDIVNNGITNGDVAYIWHTGLRMVAVALGGAACAVVAGYLSAHSAMGFGEILRRAVFSRVMTFTLDDLDRFGTPSLATRSTNDVTQVQNLAWTMLRIMVSAPIMVIGGTILAVSRDPGLSWVIIVVIPLLALSILVVILRAFPLFRAIQRKLDTVNLVLREGLTGIRVIRAFNRVDDQTERFREASADLMSTTITVNKVMAALRPLMMLLMNVTCVAILWFGAIRTNHGTSNIGNMVAFLQYSTLILYSLLLASLMFISLPRAQACAERINEVLDMPHSFDEGWEATVPAIGLRGHLEFRNVSFSYHGAESPALRDISFIAEPGEVTAIVGGTGAGKSTLLNLVPRFYDVTAGSILVDGVDVRDMPRRALRAKIGYAPQKAVLFSGSIADNIRFGKRDADDEEVRNAAATAQAEEFIMAMGDRFGSQVAQGGTNVSGGQKQRLSIARALVRKPEIYLFDDCFSALDYATDARLRAALRRTTGDATVLIVGQRVATIRDADRIIVLDEGGIAGMGTHAECIRDCEVYRQIAASQLTEEEMA